MYVQYEWVANHCCCPCTDQCCAPSSGKPQVLYDEIKDV